MPDPSTRAGMALANTGHLSRGSVALRAIVGAVFALSVLAVPSIVSPEPVVAGSSCTGWTSIKTPPRTVKVYRTRTGQVETIEFRKYVGRVMASGEWPSHLKMATIEAGAVVTKQYAWYYAMKGNHRAGYRAGKKCFDLRDDTTDQLYKHYVKPSARQLKALSTTWGLTLRKGSKFFLTGYRAGISRTCGADANGWKLYATSAESCAKQGWSHRRILTKYLSPGVRFVWTNNVGPAVSKPRIALRVGNSVASGAATVQWQPLLRKARVAGYQLQRKVSGSAWQTVKLPRAAARSVDAWVKVGAKNRFRVRARGPRGGWGSWSYSPHRRAAVRGPAGRTLAGGAKTAVVQTPKIKVRFRGHSVGLMMRTGPEMGRVRVFVDGRRVANVDLKRPRATARKLVYAKNWADGGSHAISIKPMTTNQRVDFNGFLVLR